LLDGEFNVDMKGMLEGEDLDGMVLCVLEDSFVVGDDSCGYSSGTLIYLDQVSWWKVSRQPK
jgi:hypothetical protein